MRLDLTEIFDNSVLYLEFDETTKVDLEHVDFNILNPIRVKGSVYSTNDGVFLDGKITYKYSANCARCLIDVEEEVETEISGRILEGEESVLEESEEKTIAYINGEILLDDVISDAILLSMPMKVVCKDDCKGLCPQCGKDLNKESCTCEHDDIDPRLAKLRNFLNS